jgi:hypothetical protein
MSARRLRKYWRNCNNIVCNPSACYVVRLVVLIYEIRKCTLFGITLAGSMDKILVWIMAGTVVDVGRCSFDS